MAKRTRKTAWTLADQIADGLKGSSHAYQAALAEFQNQLAISPVRALSLKSEEVVKAHTTHEFWRRVSRLAAQDDAEDVAEGIALLLKDTENQVRYFFDGNSTNLFLNAVQRARVEACVSLINYTIPVVRRFLPADE